MDEVGHGLGIEAEALLRDHCDETRARLEIGIVKLAVALVLLEVLGVGGREKRALVMIEPPGDFWRAGVLEIDDGVLVAIELLLIEQRAGAVNQARELKFGVAADALPVKAGKQRGRRSSVEALVVIKNANSQSIPRSTRIPATRRPDGEDSCCR